MTRERVLKLKTVLSLCLLWCALGCGQEEGGRSTDAFLIAHRGASAYAPEHTLAAYELALDQGADFVEPDLQVTRDGHLIALHDVTLERTTNVREIFPARFREYDEDDGVVRRWPVSDFTLVEVKSLDAGTWFSSEFAGARVPTLAEVIELARGRAGIYPETKAPNVYSGLGFSMERLLVAELERFGLERASSDPATPVVVQSFSAESLRILRNDLESDLPLTLLVHRGNAEEWTTAYGLERASEFATAIAPAKNVLSEDPDIVARAHSAGLRVVPWTFGFSESSSDAELRDEMIQFICVLGVDGLFANTPDLFPRAGSCG